jgi:hypothetical protein
MNNVAGFRGKCRNSIPHRGKGQKPNGRNDQEDNGVLNECSTTFIATEATEEVLNFSFHDSIPLELVYDSNDVWKEKPTDRRPSLMIRAFKLRNK